MTGNSAHDVSRLKTKLKKLTERVEKLEEELKQVKIDAKNYPRRYDMPD